MDSLKKWMQDSANILFDDSKNDLRALPKAVMYFHTQLLLLAGLEHTWLMWVLYLQSI